jgi:hypothetical protein
MREIRPSGLEGGVRFHSSSLPLSREGACAPQAMKFVALGEDLGRNSWV